MIFALTHLTYVTCMTLPTVQILILIIMDQSATETRSLIYYRLIALWVICEAMLGGIIHGLRIPVSGLIVGSAAVICICLIAYYNPVKGAILKATLIVAIFKMMLSPQAPLPAYIAVFFQGALGEILFWKKRFFSTCCIVLGILALLESALQRVLILTIIYGNDIWTAVNNSINRLTGQQKITDYSFFIITWYLLVHAVTGLLVGIWAGNLPNNIKLLAPIQQQYTVTTNKGETISTKGSQKNRPKKILFIVWVFIILLYAQSYFKIGTSLLPADVALSIFLRSVIIVLAWYFVAGPLIKRGLNAWLQKKKKRSQPEIQQVADLLPAAQQLVSKSWQLSAGMRGWKRIVLYCRIILANIFYTNDA